MMPVGPATRIFLAAGTTDLCKNFEGLSDLVRHRFQEDPLSGHLFVFTNRTRTRLKLLYWDGSGLWCCAKRLAKGRFSWPHTPEEQTGVLRIVAEELTLPVVRAQRLELLAGGYLQADETTLPCQTGEKTGRNHRAYTWEYSVPGGPVVFDFRMGRGRDGTKEFLNGFRGTLQSDGYGAYTEAGPEGGAGRGGVFPGQHKAVPLRPAA